MPRQIGLYRLFDEAVHQRRALTPKSLGPSLVAWWNVNNSSSLTLPNDASNPNGVANLADLGPRGLDLSQATVSQRPALVVGNFKGRNSIQFSRALLQSLNLSNFPTSGISALACYMVVRWQTAGYTNNDIQALIDNNHTGSNGWVMQDRPGLANNPLSVGHLPAPSDTIDSTTTGNDVWKIVGGVMIGGAGGTDTLFVNDEQKATQTNTNTLTPNPNLRIGGAVSLTTRFYNGFHAEIVLTTDTSSITRQRVSAYLAWNNRLADNLHTSNPFIIRPPMVDD